MKFTNMKKICSLFIALSILIFSNKTFAQDDTWPRTINAQDGSVIKIYEPAPESFSGNILKSRSAISILLPDSTEPVFGTFWAVQTVETDKDNRQINIVSAKIPHVKFAGSMDDNEINYVKTTLETQLPSVEPSLPLDAILASLETNTEEKKLSKNLENTPPKIIYTTQPSILVLIDGTPRLQHNNNWGLDAVVNTPFTIVKNRDGYFYLYGGKHWYSAPSATGPYSYTTNIPDNLYNVQSAVDNANNSDPGFSSDSAAVQPNTIANIVVSTTPAELIQTNGPASFATIDGTSLSYASNSQNDIFLSQSDQQYYVLISGRWYKSPDLNGQWQYIASNSLPADFANIPEGSPKDNVLASVAGTPAAKEAVMDAQIPQTAKVDRHTATANVSYDGDPNFQNIEGTDMQYAVNTQGSVIFDRGRYYSVDNGVWFESGSPTGPWTVCIDRPDDVDLIPPSCPDYNMKYVYIYDVNPDYVYMGYTPGYLNTFIYGPTVVYGTGFYYRPWVGRHYYARPYTWGFNMNYNPWWGWSIGYNYGFSWFNVGFGVNLWPGWGGGWWGPAVYRPRFRSYGYRSYGYYGNRPAFAGRPAIRNNNLRVNNIYNFRRDVITRNNRVYNPGNRSNNRGNNNDNRIGRRPAVNNNPVTNNNLQTQSNRSNINIETNKGGNNTPVINRPQTQPVRSNSNIQTDREGNVYQRNSSNPQQWQQRTQNQWKPIDNSKPNVIQNLNHQQQLQNRGEIRTQNFQSARQPAANNSINRPERNSGGNGNNGGGNRGGGGDGGRRH